MNRPMRFPTNTIPAFIVTTFASLQACTLNPITAASHGRLEVSGVVIDEDGKPLPEVDLRYSTSRMTKGGWDTESSPLKSLKVDEAGKFSVEARNALSVRIYADMDGYYPEFHDFSHSMEGIGERVRDAAKGCDIEQPERSENGYVIKLEKKNNPVWLDTRIGRLRFNESGEGVVFTYRPADRTIPLSSDRRVDAGFVPVEDVRHTDELPESGIKLIVETATDTGKFKIVQTPPPKLSGVVLPIDRDRPLRIRIVAFGPDTGIATYEYTDSDPYAHIEKHMHEAPEDGYERELVLSWDDYQKKVLETPTQKYFFFIKLYGTYGRAILYGGTTLYIQEMDGKQFVDVPMLFRMQPDGSRNLEMKQRF